MSTKSGKVPLKGSHRLAVGGSGLIGPAHPDEHIEVTLRLRHRAEISAKVRSDATIPISHKNRRYLTHDEYAANHGTSPEDIAKVAEFARANDLAVVRSSAARRSVWLAGTVDQMSNAFGVQLAEFGHPDGGSYRGRTGPIMIPGELEGIVVGVFGLDNRPQAKPHFRNRGSAPAGQAQPSAATGNSQFTPTQLAKLYDFPAGLNGTGQCVAIIELGGGFNTSDLKTYFSSLGIKPAPSVSSVSIDNGTNTPTGSGDGPDGEVMLDIEVAGAIAPAAKIVVYFAPNTSQGFLDAITHAVHDTVNKVSVISISWGGPESTWTGQAMQQFDEAFQAAAALGITILVAAGDNGSSDGVDDGKSHVDFPASSPNVLACGGTKLSATNTILGEVVWNEPNDGATGGGISDEFPLPSYQENAGVPPSKNPGGNTGRGVPDVAADADPETGYSVRVDGQNTVIGGTSAVAPLWAGLVACLNQGLGKPLGFLNPTLYALPSQGGVFRDITSGNNGAYAAGPGWDACTGLGVADGAKLLKAVSS